MTGVVQQVLVQEGDKVEKGTVLIIVEAMKMEHPLRAQEDGVVAEVRVKVGQQVEPDDVLVIVTPEGELESSEN